MRVNVYSQELTNEVKLIEKRSNTEITYSPTSHTTPEAKWKS